MYARQERLIDEQGTLGDLLHALAQRGLPRPVLRGLPLLLPVAAGLLAWRWYRAGALLALAGMFGVWALCDHAIEHRPLIDASGAPVEVPVWLRALHRVSSVLAVLLGAAVVVYLVVAVLGLGFACPGCAG